MNRYVRLFLSNILIFSMVGLLVSSWSQPGADTNRDYYQIKIYHLLNEAQEDRMDHYLKEAFIPALQRTGIEKVGVFKPVEEDTVSGNIIFVWIPLNSLEQFDKLPGILQKDVQYLADGKDYIDARYDNPPYGRIESILLKAFTGMPHYEIPAYTTSPGERIYELRSYESATEQIFRRKVEMFNAGGEVDLFKRLGFNPLFFAEVISGSSMPNLMYITTFSDMASHDENWKTFRNHPDWKTMSGIEKYKNTVSRVVIYLLHPTDYSGI